MTRKRFPRTSNKTNPGRTTSCRAKGGKGGKRVCGNRGGIILKGGGIRGTEHEKNHVKQAERKQKKKTKETVNLKPRRHKRGKEGKANFCRTGGKKGRRSMTKVSRLLLGLTADFRKKKGKRNVTKGLKKGFVRERIKAAGANSSGAESPYKKKKLVKEEPEKECIAKGEG